MTLRYEIIDNSEVNERNLCDWGPLRDNGWSFFRIENGEYTYLGSDNGEPEDKIFVRDFSWMLEELNYARDFHKKPTIVTVTDAARAQIRKNYELYELLQTQCTTPEARMNCNYHISLIRADCKHPVVDEGGNCADCKIYIKK